jgi:hypothetical protein
MLRYEAIVGDKAISIRQTYSNSETDFHIEYRPINPATGKPWQATRTIHHLENTTKERAMRSWLYTCANERKVCAAKKDKA